MEKRKESKINEDGERGSYSGTSKQESKKSEETGAAVQR